MKPTSVLILPTDIRAPLRNMKLFSADGWFRPAQANVSCLPCRPFVHAKEPASLSEYLFNVKQPKRMETCVYCGRSDGYIKAVFRIAESTVVRGRVISVEFLGLAVGLTELR